jgi:hypothetical protein
MALGEGDPDDGEHLRGQQRSGCPLEKAAGHQDSWILGERAQRGREGERGQPGGEYPPSPVGVAEASAGDLADGVGEGVAGDDQLAVGVAGVQVRADGRDGHVYDESVEHRDESAG